MKKLLFVETPGALFKTEPGLDNVLSQPIQLLSGIIRGI